MRWHYCSTNSSSISQPANRYPANGSNLANLAVAASPAPSSTAHPLLSAAVANIPIQPTAAEKVGLALSGGGFRAAFFHLGVLAALADADRLRQVAVISVVSGGAIVGTLYYLYLKKRLEDPTTGDRPLTARDYQQIVAQTATTFLTGVQQNIILQVYSNWWWNLRRLSPRYDVSRDLATLYDRYFYQPVGLSDQPLTLADLAIKSPIAKVASAVANPLASPAAAAPLIPQLIINTTNINTGRNWRFGSHTMGEIVQPDEISHLLDKNLRLQPPPPLAVQPEWYQQLSLSTAVAASACVPGLFNPVYLRDYYPPAFTLQLIDGGVYDNQGISALLAEQCTQLIISDAARQVEVQTLCDLRDKELGPRVRAMLIDRIRDEQIRRLQENPQIGVQLLALTHHLPLLEQPFQQAAPANQITAQPPTASKPRLSFTTFTTVKSAEAGLTFHNPQSSLPSLSPRPYLVDPLAQWLLARFRTHLDSFTEVEAFSLMALGHQITIAASSIISLPTILTTPPMATTAISGRNSATLTPLTVATTNSLPPNCFSPPTLATTSTTSAAGSSSTIASFITTVNPVITAAATTTSPLPAIPLWPFDWPFLAILPWLQRPTPFYRQQLVAGGQRFLKIFWLSASLRRRVIATTAIVLLGLALFSYQFYLYLATQRGYWTLPISAATMFGYLVMSVVIYGIAKIIAALPLMRRWHNSWLRIWRQALFPTLVFPLIYLHLALLERRFLALGSLQRCRQEDTQNLSP